MRSALFVPRNCEMRSLRLMPSGGVTAERGFFSAPSGAGLVLARPPPARITDCRPLDEGTDMLEAAGERPISGVEANELFGGDTVEGEVCDLSINIFTASERAALPEESNSGKMARRFTDSAPSAAGIGAEVKNLNTASSSDSKGAMKTVFAGAPRRPHVLQRSHM